MAELRAIKKRNAVDEVFDQMHEMIEKREWVQGTQLPSEKDLALSLGVSRFTVRTAIARFVALGIMETRNGEGTFIKNSVLDSADPLSNAINLSGIIELLQLRRGIELVAARLAAENHTEEQLKELEAILLRMERYQAEDNISSYIEEDVNFHITISKISGNLAVFTVMEMLRDSLYDHFINTAELYGIHTEDMHRNVFEAIADRNPGLAEKITSDNLMSIIEKTFIEFTKLMRYKLCI